MNYEEIKEWLSGYREMYYRLVYVKNRIEGIKPTIRSSESGSNQKKTLNDLIKEKDELEYETNRIKQAIKSVSDVKQRNVLTYKYLEFLTFEEIENAMNYSNSSVSRYHRAGIKQILKKSPKR